MYSNLDDYYHAEDVCVCVYSLSHGAKDDCVV